MKSILLASASIFAFVGAAAAEVTFAGSATLGYNDTDNLAEDGVGETGDDEIGFYWDANVAVTLSQTLDNGVTASATFDFDVADMNNGQVLESGGYLLSITSDMGGLYYGDTTFAAETYWASAGDMEADAFSEADGETVLRGEVMFGGVAAGMSYVVADSGGDLVGDNSATEDFDQLSVGATGDFGMFNFAVAYQEESTAAGAYNPSVENGDFTTSEIWGVSVGGSFAGADVRLAYASNETTGEDSTGLKISYPVGPVTATAYYVSETDNNDQDDNYGINLAYASGPIAVALDYQNDQDGGHVAEGGATKIALDGSYDVGNGLTVYAGAYMQDNEDGSFYDDEFYLAGGFDLGSGAELMVSYATGTSNGDDEIGALDLQEGATIEVTLEF